MDYEDYVNYLNTHQLLKSIVLEYLKDNKEFYLSYNYDDSWDYDNRIDWDDEDLRPCDFDEITDVSHTLIYLGCSEPYNEGKGMVIPAEAVFDKEYSEKFIAGQMKKVNEASELFEEKQAEWLQAEEEKKIKEAQELLKSKGLL